MDPRYNNPYILNKNEFPHLRGLTYKLDSFDQGEGIKRILGHCIAFLSQIFYAVNDNKVIDKFYNDLVAGYHPCADTTDLVRSGLDTTDYLANLKTLTLMAKNATPEQAAKLRVTPIFETIGYMCHDNRWNNWTKVANFPKDKESSTAFGTGLICFVFDTKEICIFDIFSLLRDSLANTADSQTAVKAGDIFVEHVKSLPSFRECYRQIAPTINER